MCSFIAVVLSLAARGSFEEQRLTRIYALSEEHTVASFEWDLVGRQYAPSAGGDVLSNVNALEMSDGKNFLNLYNYDWSRCRQGDLLEFRMAFPLDTIPSLHWKQSSVPTSSSPVEGYEAVDVQMPGSGGTSFVGLRRAVSWAVLDGSRGGIGYPGLGVSMLSGQSLLPGPCHAANDSTAWRSASLAPSGCIGVLAVELYVRRSTAQQYHVAVRPSSACQLGRWVYVTTNKGLARIPFNTMSRSLQHLTSSCDVPGYSVWLGCSGRHVGVSGDAVSCVVSDGLLGFNLTEGRAYLESHVFPVGVEDFTVAAWLRFLGSNSTGGATTIISMGALRVQVDHDTPMIECILDISTNFSVAYHTQWSVLSSPHHFACVRSESGTVLQLFVDGVLVDSHRSLVAFAIPQQGEVGYVGSAFVSDFRLYNRVVLVDEMRALTSCDKGGPSSGILCDAENQVVYFGVSQQALPGTCRVRFYDVLTGLTRGVSSSCPQSSSALHGIGFVRSLSKSGRDILMSGEGSWALVSISDNADVVFISVDSAYACSSSLGSVYATRGSSVDALMSRYGTYWLRGVYDGRGGWPAASCAASPASIFIGDQWGVLQVDSVSKRSLRVIGFVGGGSSYWRPRHDGLKATEVPVGEVTHISITDMGTLVIVGGGGIFVYHGAVRQVRHKLVYGQVGLRAQGIRVPEWSVERSNVAPRQEEIIATVTTATQQACIRECTGLSSCTGYVWYASSSTCSMVSTVDVPLMEAGSGDFHRKTLVVDFQSAAHLDYSRLSGILDVVPHAMCELRGFLYVVGGNRLLRLDLSTQSISHISGNGEASSRPAADGSATVHTELVDGPIVCHPSGLLYMGQMAHSCVRSFNISSHELRTVAGTCGVTTNTSAPSGWTSSSASISPPSGLSLDGEGTSLFIATPQTYVVWEMLLQQGLMRIVAGNGTQHPAGSVSSSGNATDTSFLFPMAVTWYGGIDGKSILIRDSRVGPGTLLDLSSGDGYTGSWISGDAYAVAQPVSRSDLAKTGEGDYPSASEAHIPGTSKGGMVLLGDTVYLPASRWPYGVMAVSRSSGGVARLPGFDDLLGATVSSSSDGTSLFVGGSSHGSGVVWQVDGLPSSALSLNGVAAYHNIFGGFEKGFTLHLSLRYDVSIGSGNWTCLMSYDYDSIVLYVQEDAFFISVEGDTAAVPASLADGLWHRVAVGWSVSGRWFVDLDGVRTKGTSIGAGTLFSLTGRLVFGCGDTVDRSLVPDASLADTYVSLHDVSLLSDYSEVLSPVLDVGHWSLDGHGKDSLGMHHLSIDSGAFFSLGPERLIPRFTSPLDISDRDVVVLDGGASWSEGGPCSNSILLTGVYQGAHLGYAPVADIVESRMLYLSAWVRPLVSDRSKQQVIISVGEMSLLLTSSLFPAAAMGNGICSGIVKVHAGEWSLLSARYDLASQIVTVQYNRDAVGVCPFTCGLGTPAPVMVGITSDRLHAFKGQIAMPIVAADDACIRCSQPNQAAPQLLIGAGGTTYYDGSVRYKGSQMQYTTTVIAVSEAADFSMGAWVYRQSATGPVLLFGVPDKVPEFSGRWCVDGFVGDMSGAIGTNFSAVDHLTMPPAGRSGPVCSAANYLLASASWPAHGSVSAWVQYLSEPAVWAQPIVSWSTDDQASYFSLVVGSQMHSDSLEGQWCTDSLVVTDGGPYNRRLAPLAVGSGGSPFVNHTGSHYACVFDEQSSPLWAEATPSGHAAMPRSGTYTTWVFIDSSFSGDSAAFTLLEAVRPHYLDPNVRLHVSHCSGSGYCSLSLSVRPRSSATVIQVSSWPHMDVPLNTWVHVAATWDGDNNNMVTLYVDGHVVKEGTISGDVQDASMLVIGGRPDSEENLKGMLHDVRIYRSSLSPAEIQSLARRTETTLSYLSWGVNDTAIRCVDTTSSAGAFPVGEWVHVTASWGREGSWVHERSASGHVRMTQCREVANSTLGRSTLDIMRLGHKLAGSLSLDTKAYIYDVRLVEGSISLQDTDWLFSQPDWSLSVKLMASGVPVLSSQYHSWTCTQAAVLLATWVHISVNWGQEAVTWYLNGEQVCRSDTTSTPPAMYGTGYVGGSPWGWYFDGYLSTLFVTPRSQHVGSVKRLMQGSEAVSADCDLLSWFPFDDDADDVFRMHSFRGHFALSSGHGNGMSLIAEADNTLSSDDWWGISGAPAVSLSIWVRHKDSLKSGGLPVFLGSDREDGPRWSEGSGTAPVNECFRESRVVLSFSFDTALDATGRNRNKVSRQSNVDIVAGRHGSGVRLASNSFLKGLDQAAGGSRDAGLTVMFWVYHSKPGAVRTMDERRALYEVAREDGDSGRAILACQSDDEKYVYMAFDTPGGVQGPDSSARHFVYNQWQHVAATIDSSGEASVFRDGIIVWSGSAVNASSPWVWGTSSTIVGHYNKGYRVQEGVSCGDPSASFVHPMPDGSNSTYLIGTVHECKERCDAYSECDGFVYIYPGDEAPPHRCYFRTSTSYSVPDPQRVCFTKGRGASSQFADFVIDDLVVLDYAAPLACVQEAFSDYSAASPCTDTIPDAAVSMKISFATDPGNHLMAVSDGVPVAALDGVTVFDGTASLSGISAITAVQGCTLVDMHAILGGESYDAPVIDLELPLYTGRLYSLRIQAGNSDTVDHVLRVDSWTEVIIPGQSTKQWFSAISVVTADLATWNITYAGEGWFGGNVTVYQLEVCGAGTENTTCMAWRCTCQGASDYFGISSETDGCTDVISMTWWQASLCATYPQVGRHQACSSQRPSWSISWWMKPEGDEVQAILPSAIGHNCSLVHEAVRSSAHVSLGVWQWFLCKSAGGLVIHSTVDGIGSEVWWHDGAPEFLVGSWSHVTVVVDGTSRRLYKDGALIHSHNRPSMQLQWHSTTQFFVSSSNSSSPLLVHDIFVVQGSYCDPIYRNLAISGIVPYASRVVPCQLSASRPIVQNGLWAYYTFDEGWTSGGGRVLHDSSRNRRHLVAVPSDSASLGAETHSGAVAGAGGSYRVSSVPLRQGYSPSSGQLSVSFWVNALWTGYQGEVLRNSVTRIVCETRACDLVSAGSVLTVVGNVSQDVCKDLCMSDTRCRVATWTQGLGRMCTLGEYLTSSPRIFREPVQGAAYVKRGGEMVTSCRTSGKRCNLLPHSGQDSIVISDVSLSECRSKCTEHRCQVGQWSASVCTLSPSMASEPRYSSGEVVTFEADLHPSFGAVVFSTGCEGQELRVGTAFGKLTLGLRSNRSEASRGAVLRYEESLLQHARWHHVVFVHHTSRASIFIDGSFIEAEDFRNLDSLLPGTWPSLAWCEDAEWLVGSPEVEVLFDDVAVWNRALEDSEAIEVYRRTVGWAGLSPSVWHHIVWTMDRGLQTWYVDGVMNKTCGYIGGGRVVGKGSLRLGSGGAGQLHGNVDDLKLFSRVLTGEEIQSLALGRAAVSEKRKTALSPPPYDVSDWVSDPPSGGNNIQVAHGTCSGCSRDCSDLCHESLYSFDAGGKVVVDESGNGRHAYLDGLEVGAGVFGTSSVRDRGGGSVVLSGPAYRGLWGTQLSQSAKVSFMAWVMPLAMDTGTILSISPSGHEGVNSSHTLWQDGGALCSGVHAASCCTEDILIPQQWQHIAMSTALDKGSLVLYHNGVLAARCRTLEGLVSLPADPYVSLFTSVKGTGAGFLGSRESFSGSIDDARLSSAEYSDDAVLHVYLSTCDDCGTCAEVSRTVLSPSDDVTLFGGPAVALRSRTIKCTSDITSAEVLISSFIRDGAVSLSVPFVGPSCSVLCNTSSGVHLLGCGFYKSSLSYVGDGWFHCVARLASQKKGRATVTVVVPDTVVLGAFQYSDASSCGDAKISYPAELCDPLFPGSSRCLPDLCTIESNPHITDVHFQHVSHLQTAGTHLQIVALPSLLSRGIKVFISNMFNCSDVDSHRVAVFDTRGIAEIPSTDAVFSTTDRGTGYICGQVFPITDHHAYGVLKRMALYPCTGPCLQGGTCDITSGTCVCPFGFTGPSCDKIVDGCAIAPDDAFCRQEGVFGFTSVLSMGGFPTAHELYRVDPCVSPVCEMAGGSCHAPGICACPEGFQPPHCLGCVAGRTGVLCDQYLCTRYCEHGECRVSSNGVSQRCICSEGWRGDDCSRPHAFFKGLNESESIIVSEDGMQITSLSPLLRVVIAFPLDDDLVFDFSASISVGSRVGLCRAGSQSVVGGDASSWGIEVLKNGTLLACTHGSCSALSEGYGARTYTIQLDTSFVMSVRSGQHAMHVFGSVCTEQDCVGCASLSSGAFILVH